MRKIGRSLPFLILPLLIAGNPRGTSAQSVTFERNDHPSAAGARGVTSADFNRDGWIDIAVANHLPDGISVLLNQHGTGFAASFIPQVGGPFDITTGDLNNDGLTDIVVANADGNMINVAFGLAGGGFRPPLQVGAMGNPRGVTVADMDRDGNLDIVYTQYYFQGAQVLYGDGAGSFDRRTMGAATVGVNPQGVVVADFNMDGEPDIAVAASGSVGLTILTRHPVGNYSRQDPGGPASVNVLAVGDFNGDGRPDIAAASSATSDVVIYLNTRDRGLVPGASLPSGASPRGIEAVDVNRDGALDLITGNRGSNSASLFLGDGRGGFAGATDVPVGTGGRDVTVADFDNDGRVDAATGNEYAANVTVLSNVTSFTPSAFAFHAQSLGVPTYTYVSSGTTDIADFNLDGKPDVITQAGQGVAVIDGNGGTTTIQALGTPRGMKAGRFNADGHDDILFLDRAGPGNLTTTLVTLLGNGTGRFPNAVATGTNIVAAQLEVGDLNHDGKLDAVIAGDAPIVQVFLGNGDGRFTFAGNLYPDLWRSRVTLADVDRDGFLDIGIYSLDESSNQFVEYRVNNRNPMPFFSRRGIISFTRWVAIQGARFGDVNHDGYLDLVASGGYTQTFAVALGGPSGFGEPTYSTIGAYLYPFELADITLDGHLDAINGAGQIMAGAGDGSFGQAQRFTMFGTAVQVFDYNRDGLPDIVHPMSLGEAGVLVNQRTGTNTPPVVNAGPDQTISYEEQLVEQEFGPVAVGRDADLHWVDYEWSDAAGNIIGHDQFLTMPVTMPPGRHEFFVTATDGRGGSARDSIVYTVTPHKEIVLDVAYRAWSEGNWGVVPDGTAASGYALHDTDAGTPKMTAPLAAPAGFSEFAFIADPTQTYKLWVRLKADGDRWSNDSLWLQFTGAVDQDGRAFEPGTASGIAVNLEECSNCGVAGWGWRDDAWGQPGAMSAMTLRFPKGGYQRIRIQTREDGVSIDQIVLSAEKYLTTRPGAVKNDATILPATRRFED